VLLVWGLVSALAGEFGSMEINLPEYATRLYAMIPDELKLRMGIETPAKVYARIDVALAQLRNISMGVVRDALSFVTHAFSSTLAFLLGMVNYLVIPVYLLYLLAEYPALKPGLLQLSPARYRALFARKLEEIGGILSAFVRGQLSVCAILAVLYSVGLYLIGIDLAVVIGTLGGVTFIIPYFGTIIAVVRSMAVAAVKFHDLLHPLLCVGWIALVQCVESWVITPNLVGNRVGIHPIVALLAILIGGQAFGLLGMLLAIPIVAVVKILGRTVMELYRESGFYREGA
ncbi:MAG TPA: AI-2E family transporter, partial [Verrucomicrobiae bacterium]|nr:AI-2E family transporter [Verrucomicrobiae bacterium]